MRANLFAGLPWLALVHSSTHTPRHDHQLVARADCRAIEVVSGDTCATLAARCDVSQTQLKNYNKLVTNFCTGLKPRQHVCCSTGDLPICTFTS